MSEIKYINAGYEYIILREGKELGMSSETLRYIGKLEREIKRLNNIINELEHRLYQEWLEWKDSNCESIYSRAGEDKAIYDYLQELKKSDSNE